LAKSASRIQEDVGKADSSSIDDGKDLEQVRDEIDQLAARAGSVNESIDRLKQQQATAGYGLRGDIAGQQESMKFNLSRAQDAAEKGDAAKAKKYADKVTPELETLEKFLGR
jgi:chromosome segregation ATPase